MLDADGEADHGVGDAERRAPLRRQRGVRHDRRVLDERLDAAERLRQGEEPEPLEEAARVVEAAPKVAGDHAAEAAHLPLRERVLGVGRQPRVAHPGDLRVRLEEPRDRHGVGLVLPHPERKRLHPAHGEPAVHGARHRADGVLQEAEALRQVLAVGHDHAADHVRVPGQVLGGRVDHHVDAEAERLLEVGAREGVVADGEPSVPAGDGGHRLEVDELQRGVGRGLDPDAARPSGRRAGEVGRVGQVGVGEVEPVVAQDPLEQAEGAAVHVVHRDDVVARLEEVHDRRRGGHPAREGEPEAAPLERRHVRLVGRARGVLRARVVVTAVPARRLLDERRGLVDRRHDGARRRVGLLPRVDRQRLEPVLGPRLHAVRLLRST